jgi:hypothetical protein
MGFPAARSIPFLAAALATSLAACGEPDPPPPSGGPPRHVRIEGTPHQVGKAHGTALKAEIAEAVGPRMRATLRAAAAATGATEEFLRTACLTYAGQMKEFLPESVREELRGLAEGSGQSEEDLFLLDVVREGLRWHGSGPRMLEASFASPPAEETGSAFAAAAYQGFVEGETEGRLVVLERNTEGAESTVVLTWPGSLGALAGSSPYVWAVQGEVGLDVRRGSLKGPPFGIGLRVALERAKTLDDFWARLPKLTGNRVLASEAGPWLGDSRPRRMGLVAYAGDDAVDHAPNDWVLAPAGVGGADSPRTRAQDERLGSYATRPGAEEAIALALAGRSGTGPVVTVSRGRLDWWGSEPASTRPPATYRLERLERFPISPLWR